jgi:Periplasmic binding protein
VANIKAGMEAVFNRTNEAGGVHGRKIKLIAYDHVYQPPKWDPGWGLAYSYGSDQRRVMSRAACLVMVKDGKWGRLGEWLELEEMAQR